MAAKVTFDPILKEIIVTQAPDGDGVITLNVQVDLYSDGKEDWLTVPGLANFEFPIDADGGQDTAAGTRGTLYTILAPWKLRLFDADHELRIDGTLVASDGSRVWEAPANPRTIAVLPLAPPDLVYLAPPTADSVSENVWGRVLNTGESASVVMEIMEKVLRNKMVTNPATGDIIVYEDDGTTPFLSASLFEDADATQPYRGEGADRRERLT